MTTPRPDPDALLARVAREQAQRGQGKLKIYFGATAGVGKTYAMLESAHMLKARGVDVVVGYVEPHGRQETEALLQGLEQLPEHWLSLHGRTLREFDLDAALVRHPSVLLVDELAHSNPAQATPRPRHAKRWHDVRELLAAGINVHTTLNVQHLESLNDVVASITGQRMQETVPDAVFELADEVELLDTPPDELLERLRAGKVYVPQEARRAMRHFFRKGNLIALREMALRTTADRVDRAMREYREDEAIRNIWAAGERLLVAIGPDEQGERLVRAGKRLAGALHAPWIVVYVETPHLLRLSQPKRNERIALLRLAESLGAETVTLDGLSAGQALADYARERNVSRILLGQPRRALWQRLLRPSTYGELLALTKGIDLVVVGGADSSTVRRSAFLARSHAYLTSAPRTEHPLRPLRLVGYVWGTLGLALCTALGELMSPRFERTNIAMMYLFVVAAIALRLGRGPAIAASILAVAAFDFLDVPPRYSLSVNDWQYLVTFAIMLALALVLANLAASVRLQARVAGHRERRTALLYAMSRELGSLRDEPSMARAAVWHVAEVFESQVTVLLPDVLGKLTYPQGKPLNVSLRSADLSVAQWVLDHGEAAGLGTDTLPGNAALYLPLKGAQGMERMHQTPAAGDVLGVLALLPANPRRVLLPEQFHLLETFAAQIALALERSRFAQVAVRARIEAEKEGVRNALLASISHDLRAPLAGIVEAVSRLTQQDESLTRPERQELLSRVFEQATQVRELISDVLDMTRLQAGAVAPRLEWHAMTDIVTAALQRLRERLQQHRVELDLPADLPAVRVDAGLIEQVLVNLLDNVAKYTPPGTLVRIRVWTQAQELRVAVEDEGPGLPAGEPDVLFAKFHRGMPQGAPVGSGLGLAICRAIVELHGGRIWAERRSKGAAFCLALSLAAQAPPPLSVPRGEPAQGAWSSAS